MPYEIEKRALLTKEQYEKLMHELSKKREPEHFFMRTYLFTSPQYIRLRLIDGQKDVIITKKSGTDNKYARLEEEKKISTLEAKDYLSFLKSKGFKECTYFTTDRYSFNFDGISFELNDVMNLGLILEVEAIIDDQTEFENYSIKLSEKIKDLGLKELPLETYKSMRDKMRQKSIISIDKVEL